MRLILHILKKDLRRLWPAIAVVSVMQAVLTNADRWRADTNASAMEGWMNPLLTMAWACLAALAVLEEPLVGHRNFWTTRPYRWFPLLISKVLFAVLSIHLTSVLADVFILASRGFPPFDYSADLLWKQVILFGSVTVPAIALASLVRSFTHFVIALFVIAASIAMLAGGTQNMPVYRNHEDVVRHAIVWTLLSIAGFAAILMQYSRRRVFPARTLAATAAALAATVYSMLPASAAFRVLGGSSPPPRITLREIDSNLDSGVPVWQPSLRLHIGVDPGERFSGISLPLVDAHVSASNGAVVDSVRYSPGSYRKIDLSVGQTFSLGGEPRLLFIFSRPAWERIRNTRVRIHGTAGIEFYRDGTPTLLPLHGSAMVSGVGRCSAFPVGDRYSREMLKVFCESPRGIPSATVVLRDPASGREWHNGLSSLAGQTWISPLERGQTFFQTSESSFPGSQFIVPGELLPTIRVSVTPRTLTRYALAPFDFPRVELSDQGQRAHAGEHEQ